MHVWMHLHIQDEREEAEGGVVFGSLNGDAGKKKKKSVLTSAEWQNVERKARIIWDR